MSNRSSGLAFKTAVVLHLHTLGFAQAKMNSSTKISDALRWHSDVSGLPVSVVVRNGVEMKLSETLRYAQSAAQYEDKRFGVAIHSRRGYEVGGSYVAMTLDDFVLHVLPHLPQPVEVAEDE